MNVYAGLILAALLLDYVLNAVADALNLGALQEKAPTGFEDVYDAGRLPLLDGRRWASLAKENASRALRSFVSASTAGTCPTSRSVLAGRRDRTRTASQMTTTTRATGPGRLRRRQPPSRLHHPLAATDARPAQEGTT